MINVETEINDLFFQLGILLLSISLHLNLNSTLAWSSGVSQYLFEIAMIILVDMHADFCKL